MTEYFNVLKNSRLFTGMTAEDIDSLLKCISPEKREYKKNEYIWRQGEKTEKIGMPVSGWVHIAEEDYWGNRSILASLRPPEIFGESYACAGEPLKVSVIAPVRSTVIFFNISRMLKTCGAVCPYHSRLIKNMLFLSAHDNIMLSWKLIYISRRTIREKIMAYLSDMSLASGSASFTIPFGRQELADYLNCNRSALSKELCVLRDENIITFSKNRFTIL